VDDKRADRLEEKIDIVVEKIANIDVTLAKQSVLLDEHIRRTNLLEDTLEPIKNHVNKVDFILKLIGASGIVGGALHLFFKLFVG